MANLVTEINKTRKLMKVEAQSIDLFAQHVQGMCLRLGNLYENANAEYIKSDILPQALVELGNVSELVYSATEELYQQQEELLETRNLLEAKQQFSEDLFELAPECYLVTDENGIILKANRVAALLFNCPQQYMLGKPIIAWVALSERQRFYDALSNVYQRKRTTRLALRFKKANGVFFDGLSSVGVDSDRSNGKAIALRWIIHDLTEYRQDEYDLDSDKHFALRDRQVHKYYKGDTIALNPLTIWYVTQGTVKLTTICETGEEMLIGLAAQEMIFGSSMTSQHTYQATALSDVELVSIHQGEIAASLPLGHALLPKINQRLQQTESFLVNCGRRRIRDRLYYLLLLLEHIVGEPTTEGVCLNIRLTHEEIAGACGSSRVTITRLLNKFQAEGKIGFDHHHHIIVLYAE